MEEPTEEDITFILNELDTNGDGKISQGEFEALVVDVVKLIEEEKTGKQAEWVIADMLFSIIIS